MRGYLILLLIASVGLGACNKKEKAVTKKRKPLPKVKVTLPPVENLTIPSYKRYYADQSLSVQHLIRNFDKLSKKNKTGVVAVTGRVFQLKACATKKGCKTAPHFFLVDKKQDPHFKLLVTDIPEDKVEALKVGIQFRVEGRLARFSSDGNFSSMRGLLRYKSATNLEAPEKPEEPAPKKKRRKR